MLNNHQLKKLLIPHRYELQKIQIIFILANYNTSKDLPRTFWTWCIYVCFRLFCWKFHGSIYGNLNYSKGNYCLSCAIDKKKYLIVSKRFLKPVLCQNLKTLNTFMQHAKVKMKSLKFNIRCFEIFVLNLTKLLFAGYFAEKVFLGLCTNLTF